jgi:hypothetical protein
VGSPKSDGWRFDIGRAGSVFSGGTVRDQRPELAAGEPGHQDLPGANLGRILERSARVLPLMVVME